MSDSTHIHGEELQDLLDARLADPRRAEVHSHVQECTRCRRELEALRIASERARAIATNLPVPPELMQRVSRALDAEDARLRPVLMTRRRWIVSGLAAAAAVVVMVRVRRAPQVPSLVADISGHTFRAGSRWRSYPPSRQRSRRTSCNVVLGSRPGCSIWP